MTSDDLKLHDPVNIITNDNDHLQGIIAHLGPVKFSTGSDWIGIRLTGPSVGMGKNDGTVKGNMYFDSRGENNGMFVKKSNVTGRALTKLDSLRPRKEIGLISSTSSPDANISAASPVQTRSRTSISSPIEPSLVKTSKSTKIIKDAVSTSLPAAMISVNTSVQTRSRISVTSPRMVSVSPSIANGKSMNNGDVVAISSPSSIKSADSKVPTRSRTFLTTSKTSPASAKGKSASSSPHVNISAESQARMRSRSSVTSPKKSTPTLEVGSSETAIACDNVAPYNKNGKPRARKQIISAVKGNVTSSKMDDSEINSQPTLYEINSDQGEVNTQADESTKLRPKQEITRRGRKYFRTSIIIPCFAAIAAAIVLKLHTTSLGDTFGSDFAQYCDFSKLHVTSCFNHVIGSKVRTLYELFTNINLKVYIDNTFGPKFKSSCSLSDFNLTSCVDCLFGHGLNVSCDSTDESCALQQPQNTMRQWLSNLNIQSYMDNTFGSTFKLTPSLPNLNFTSCLQRTSGTKSFCEGKEALSEYQRMYFESEQVKKEDLSLIVIGESQIHGRGVLLTRKLPASTRIGTLYYEVESESAFKTHLMPLLASGKKGFIHARGFIPDGGTIDRQTMPVREARARCDSLPTCEGITFHDEDHHFVDPLAEPTHDVVVEFKDKVAFHVHHDWQSYLSHTPTRTAAYFPLGCNAGFFPNPPLSTFDPSLILPCWPRYVNHNCNPTARVVATPVPDNFVVPGLPWLKVLHSYELELVRELDAGEEVSLNYELLPSYMLRKLDGVKECDETED